MVWILKNQKHLKMVGRKILQNSTGTAGDVLTTGQKQLGIC